MTVFSHPDFDQHEKVAFHHDRASGLTAIIAVHNTRLGPALGGCRIYPYSNDAEALRDVLRLSRGMTYKASLARLPLGGGKSVIIANPHTDKTPELLAAMGDFVESFNGTYITAADSGSGVPEMEAFAKRTRHVVGAGNRDASHGGNRSGDPSPSTVNGVFAGLKAAAGFRLDRDLQGLNVAVQGVGQVGFGLAAQLVESGANVWVSDVYPANVERAVRELGVTAVAPDDIYGLDVDVFAPCAMGGILNETTLPVLKAKVIAGAANNQLGTAAIANELHQRGILYAPDYAINAGGLIDVFYEREGGSADTLNAHVLGIADTLKEIFLRSQEENLPTAVVADRVAMERVNAG